MGIDPGQNGGIAICWDSSAALTYPLPVREGELRVAELIVTLTQMRGEVRACALEHVMPMTKNGSIASFKLGKMFGQIHASLIAVGMPVLLVRPHVWAKEFPTGVDAELPYEKRAPLIKKARAEIVLGLFGGVDIPRSPKAKNLHDGRVDALLIAEYGRRKIRKGEWDEQAGN